MYSSCHQIAKGCCQTVESEKTLRAWLCISKVHNFVCSEPACDHHPFGLQAPRLLSPTARVGGDHFALCHYNPPEGDRRFRIFCDRHQRPLGQKWAGHLSIVPFCKRLP